MCEAREPVGALVRARHLKDYGVELSARAVRYHLKLMDERGLTCEASRDGRLISGQGIDELKGALVQHKVGPVLSRIETLGLQKDFDWQACTGSLPVNISLFPRRKLCGALSTMAPVFQGGSDARNSAELSVLSPRHKHVTSHLGQLFGRSSTLRLSNKGAACRSTTVS